MANPYDTGLDKTPANYQPLTPLVFLERAASVHPEHVAVIHGKSRLSYAELYARTRQLASALAARGIGVGDTVSVMLANTPAMLEAHFGVPMTGAVLHAINTRLDAPAVAFMLDHAKTKVLIGDTEFLLHPADRGPQPVEDAAILGSPLLAIGEGTNELQRIIIARELVKRNPA